MTILRHHLSHLLQMDAFVSHPVPGQGDPEGFQGWSQSQTLISPAQGAQGWAEGVLEMGWMQYRARQSAQALSKWLGKAPRGRWPGRADGSVRQNR